MMGTLVDFTDDVCLLTHRPTDMKAKGEGLQKIGGQVGLKLDIQKRKEMPIGVTAKNI